MTDFPADIISKAQETVSRISARMEASSTLGDAATEVIAEALMEMKPVVKPLEWEYGEGNYEGQQVWHSGDPWLFWIVKNTNSDEFVWCETLNLEGFIPASPVRGSFDTLEAAKTAAQTDFQARTLSCIRSGEQPS